MSSDLSPKKESMVVTIMTLICTIVILIPLISWHKQIIWNIKSSLGWLFVTVDIILCFAFLIMTRKNYKDASTYETETNGPRWLTVLIAISKFIWVAGWAAYANEFIK